MKKFYTVVFLILSIVGNGYTQELNCDVTIIPPQLVTTDPAIFQSMETDFEQFLNARKWTNDNFSLEERIECNIQITIETQANARLFQATLQVGSSRPVYNSDYKTPILSLNDRNFDFIYDENTLIQWSSDQHRDNLSSTLAYYAYLIIGMDYDSFSMEGGNEALLLCQTIVSNAQTAPDPGWRANEKNNQNRYWLIENLMAQTFKPLRECMYNYHRLGMDKLESNPEAARKVIGDALVTLRSIHKIKPSSYNLQVFFYAKSDEIVNLFKPTPVAEKQRIYDLLKQIDPGNISKYENLMK
jgi:hypothetical protein